MNKNIIHVGFNEFLYQHGKLFFILFHFFFIVFALQLIAMTINFFVKENYWSLIIPALLAFILIKYLRKGNLSAMFIVMFLFSPFGILIWAIAPLIQTNFGLTNITFYVLLSIHTLIAGIITSYIFNKSNDNFKGFIDKGFFLSFLLAIVFGINGVQVLFLSRLSEQLALIPEGIAVELPAVVNLLNFETFNGILAFSLAYALFTIPYMIAFFKRKDFEIKYLFLFLVPILLYSIMAFLFVFFINRF